MGDVPLKPGWRRWRFDQMAANINDRIDNPSEAGVERYVGLEHLDPDSLQIRRWGMPSDVEATKLRFKKGDIIFGRRRAYQRKLAVADFDGICSAHAMVLRAKPEVVLPDFLPFFMQSDLFMERALEISVGSLSPTINWKTLAAQEFALPPLEEQRQISDVLLTVEQCLYALAGADAVAASFHRSMSHHLLGSSDRYQPEALDRHYTVVSGQVDPTDVEFRDLPLIAPNHIVGGTGELLDAESAASQGAISGKYLFEAGAVIYSKIRPNLVKATIAPYRGLCSADMYALNANSSIRNQYLLEILLSENFTRFAVSGSARTGIPKLNREHLAKYKCVVPSLDEQDQYLITTGAIRQCRVLIAERRAVAEHLKACMLNGLDQHVS